MLSKRAQRFTSDKRPSKNIKSKQGQRASSAKKEAEEDVESGEIVENTGGFTFDEPLEGNDTYALEWVQKHLEDGEQLMRSSSLSVFYKVLIQIEYFINRLSSKTEGQVSPQHRSLSPNFFDL